MGPHVQTYLLARELLSRGWSVSYISLGADRASIEYRCIDGIGVHFIPKKFRLLPANSLWEGLEVQKILRKITPDVVYTRGRSLLPWAVSRYGRGNGALSIWNAAKDRDFNRYEYPRTKSRHGGPVQRWAKYLLFSFTHVLLFERGVRSTGLCICQNRLQEEVFLKSYSGRKAELLGSIADIPQGIARKDETPRVLWVSGIKEEKQPEMFVRLAEKCRDAEIRFDCIGDPLDRRLVAGLENCSRIHGNFHYHGHIDYFEIERFFQKAHVFVNTSVSEGFPNTYLQAWANETPVISLQADPNRLLSERKLGVLAGSFERLCRSVCELLKDPEKRREIGTRAREYVVSHHSPDLIVDQLEEHIASARRGRGPTLWSDR
ncbi:MAG: glycosyltransferase family 4 protein [Deltaproteobacteria bacterium]|nr:glycosyltransferase family 4 protein [Deltaproteobacteria bacterium]